MKRPLLTLAVLLLIAAEGALAELPPFVYEDLQRKAPEVLYIQVSSTDVHRSLAKPHGCAFFDFEIVRQVNVEARVIRVIRSAVGVRPGDKIEIDYTSVNRCSGWSGPRSIQMLRDGDQVYAFLSRGDRAGSFVPAARGATFSSTSPTAADMPLVNSLAAP
jgi:hypothetical protein